ncbi:MAG: acetate--CoA ligase family protein [Rhizobiaceae bacterium]|nr:acetate--CoA ligase family protein [Rhizobiaceae bacterium]
MTASAENIARLLAPKSVCIVSASDKLMSPGANVLANFEAFELPGELHLVNRSRESIGKYQCLKSIEDLPHSVDAVVLIMPVGAVKRSIIARAKMGIGGMVIFAAGFSELGDEGRREQDEIAAIANKAGMALLGPNCLGFTNFQTSAPLTFERVLPHNREGEGVAILAQSGVLSGNIRQVLVPRGLTISHSISTVDILNLIVEDENITSFVVFVEQTEKAQAFLQFAEWAWDLGKSVVIMHPGRSERSKEAAKSHTGAMAGNYAAMKAMVSEFGISVVESFDELFDTITLHHRYGHTQIGGLGIMTNSGAVRGFVLDFCDDLDLPLPLLTPQTTTDLAAVLPDYAGVDNPLDITAAGMSQPSLFGDTAQFMLDDDNLDGLLIVAIGGNPTQVMAKWNSLKPVSLKAKKPVALTFLGDNVLLSEEFMADIAQSGIPFFRSPERALRAFSQLMQTRRAPGLHAGDLQNAIPQDEPQFIVKYLGKEILREAGIQTPEGSLATDLEAAKQIAGKIGYPVAIKVQATEIVHKSGMGGVQVNLKTEADLATAWQEIEAAIASHAPDEKIDGMLVEKMASPFEFEMVISVRRDPDWGPMLVFGLGGVWTELFQDFQMLLAGLGPERYEEALRILKGFPLLNGYRGGPKLHISAVLDALENLTNYMASHPEIGEIKINPLVLYNDGEETLALDALVSRWEQP